MRSYARTRDQTLSKQVAKIREHGSAGAILEGVPAVRVTITRYVEDYQPGVVECCLTDAAGRQWTFIEKAPVVTTGDCHPTSPYPLDGCIECTVLGRISGDAGHDLIEITTQEPLYIESTDGQSVFTVFATQVVDTA